MDAPWEHEPTPSLETFVEAEKQDPNLWWRIGCGHHQNLLDQALDRIEALQLRVETLRHLAVTSQVAGDKLDPYDILTALEE